MLKGSRGPYPADLMSLIDEEKINRHWVVDCQLKVDLDMDFTKQQLI